MIGSGSRFMYNVRIGSNVIWGAAPIVTKDISDNCVAAGVHCRVIGSFDDLVEKRKRVIAHDNPEEYWTNFFQNGVPIIINHIKCQS